MPKKYTLTLSDDADSNMRELAASTNTTPQEVLRNALNTYATLKRLSRDGNVWVQTDRDDKIVLKKVALP